MFFYTEEEGQKVRQRKMESHYSIKTATEPLEMAIMLLGYITESCSMDNNVSVYHLNALTKQQ